MSDVCQLTILHLQHLDSNVTFMRAVMLVCAVCQCDLKKKKGEGKMKSLQQPIMFKEMLKLFEAFHV